MSRSNLSVRAAIAIAGAIAVGLIFAAPLGAQGESRVEHKTWGIKAEYIEACSCNLFCMCYFNTHPDGEMFCEFNNAVKIIEGHVGDVKVDGVYVWVSGDLGGDFTAEKLKSAVLTFQPGLTAEQKDAIRFLMVKVYPFQWERFSEDEQPITWRREGLNGYAKLGDRAEVWLTGVKDAEGKATVIQNLPYWGAQKNTGFYLAHGKHYYKGFGHDYAHEGKNGFFITIESSGTIDD